MAFLIRVQQVRPNKQKRCAAQRTVETTIRVKRTIPSLKDGRTFESFGLAVMFAVAIVVVAVGYALVCLLQ